MIVIQVLYRLSSNYAVKLLKNSTGSTWPYIFSRKKMELMEIWVQTGTLNTLPHVATRRIELFLLREDTAHKLPSAMVTGWGFWNDWKDAGSTLGVRIRIPNNIFYRLVSAFHYTLFPRSHFFFFFFTSDLIPFDFRDCVTVKQQTSQLCPSGDITTSAH